VASPGAVERPWLFNIRSACLEFERKAGPLDAAPSVRFANLRR